MKLVGATRSFIRKPFLKAALVQGLVSALVASLILFGLLLLTIVKDSKFRCGNLHKGVPEYCPVHYPLSQNVGQIEKIPKR